MGKGGSDGVNDTHVGILTVLSQKLPTKSKSLANIKNPHNKAYCARYEIDNSLHAVVAPKHHRETKYISVGVWPF
jgi:hypothetical protein